MSDQEQPAQRGEPKPVRPRMPVGYGIHSLEAGGLIPWHTVTEQVANARNYWVVTTG